MDLLVTEAVGVLPADTALDQAVVATVVLQSRERWAHTGGIWDIMALQFYHQEDMETVDFYLEKFKSVRKEKEALNYSCYPYSGV